MLHSQDLAPVSNGNLEILHSQDSREQDISRHSSLMSASDADLKGLSMNSNEQELNGYTTSGVGSNSDQLDQERESRRGTMDRVSTPSQLQEPFREDGQGSVSSVTRESTHRSYGALDSGSRQRDRDLANTSLSSIGSSRKSGDFLDNFEDYHRGEYPDICRTQDYNDNDLGRDKESCTYSDSRDPSMSPQLANHTRPCDWESDRDRHSPSLMRRSPVPNTSTPQTRRRLYNDQNRNHRNRDTDPDMEDVESLTLISTPPRSPERCRASPRVAQVPTMRQPLVTSRTAPVSHAAPRSSSRSSSRTLLATSANGVSHVGSFTQLIMIGVYISG